MFERGCPIVHDGAPGVVSGVRGVKREPSLVGDGCGGVLIIGCGGCVVNGSVGVVIVVGDGIVVNGIVGVVIVIGGGRVVGVTQHGFELFVDVDLKEDGIVKFVEVGEGNPATGGRIVIVIGVKLFVDISLKVVIQELVCIRFTFVNGGVIRNGVRVKEFVNVATAFLARRL
jgi:hypothetical protein